MWILVLIEVLGSIGTYWAKTIIIVDIRELVVVNIEYIKVVLLIAHNSLRTGEFCHCVGFIFRAWWCFQQ